MSDPTATSPLEEPGEPDAADFSSESRLLGEARQGSPDAARMALKRSLVRLGDVIPDS